ncbi:RidA family protein [Shinella sp. CPCC 101442]|uniref:RidA family protein n=1 Tax=Shinella sp. CPCC 101442 TaxID=2932265 RepID=UPI0021536A5D|nr:RidA family protein [Shinella sp. CPCC 101442]MCR6500952.1 RidA family protein [Shinella sp. CPCC 101442]
MKRELSNAKNVPAPRGGYSQAVKIEDFKTLLFISGQIPVSDDDKVPETFEDQARLVWRNIDAQLKAAGMAKADLVKVTTFLSDRHHATANREIRSDYLGTIAPAMSVVIASIFDEKWLLEVEAIAAR